MGQQKQQQQHQVQHESQRGEAKLGRHQHRHQQQLQQMHKQQQRQQRQQQVPSCVECISATVSRRVLRLPLQQQLWISPRHKHQQAGRYFPLLPRQLLLLLLLLVCRGPLLALLEKRAAGAGGPCKLSTGTKASLQQPSSKPTAAVAATAPVEEATAAATATAAPAAKGAKGDVPRMSDLGNLRRGNSTSTCSTAAATDKKTSMWGLNTCSRSGNRSSRRHNSSNAKPTNAHHIVSPQMSYPQTLLLLHALLLHTHRLSEKQQLSSSFECRLQELETCKQQQQ